MKKTPPHVRPDDNLRRHAEQRLPPDAASTLPPATEADALAQVHELQVHQIELEMQNEELQRAQIAITALGARYRALYDFAPIGYLTLDARGRILEANLAGATLLRMGQHDLINRRFSSLLSLDSQAAYRSFFRRLKETRVRQTCEFSLSESEGTLRYLQAEAGITEDVWESDGQILMAILEITERKRLTEQGRQAAILQERNRMAQDIHDTLAQGFTGILVQLEAASYAPEQELARVHIAQARDLARRCLQEARRSMRALRPQALEGKDLADALADIVAQITSTLSMNVQFQVHGMPYSLPDDVENQLFRIGQEALTNAIKHSEAAVIRIDLSFEPEQVWFCVQDDGKGFDAQAGLHGEGFGLVGIYERAEKIEGRITIASRAGDGTTITVTVSKAVQQAKERPL